MGMFNSHSFISFLSEHFLNTIKYNLGKTVAYMFFFPFSPYEHIVKIKNINMLNLRQKKDVNIL